MKTIKTEKYKDHIVKYFIPETESEKIDVEKLEKEVKAESKNIDISKWKIVKNKKVAEVNH